MNKRDEIMTVATRLFAAGGYESVSVREICAEAGVNVAMVNYHFRNKEGLYRECVERLFRKIGAADSIRLAETVRDAASWREAVRAWIAGFSRVIHAPDGDEALAGRLYRHEVVHASSMRDFILRNYVRPLRKSLMKLIRMTGLGEDDAYRWASAVWSLLSAYVIVDPAWRREFSPGGADESKWSEQFREFVCERIFGELRYRKG